MINRFFKRDVESSKRRMCKLQASSLLLSPSSLFCLLLLFFLSFFPSFYFLFLFFFYISKFYMADSQGEDIKTYTVTPLNEECGLIEWVDNLRTLRELVIKLLRERGITPNVWQYSSYYYTKRNMGADFFFRSTMRSSTIWTKHAQTFPSFICLQPEY